MYDFDQEELSDVAVIGKRVSQAEHAANLRGLIGKAMDKGMAIGRNVDSPNLAQQSWMAAMLNGAGFFNPKCGEVTI